MKEPIKHRPLPTPARAPARAHEAEQLLRSRIRERRRALQVMHSSSAAFAAKRSNMHMVKLVMMCSLQMPLITRTLQMLRRRKQSRWKISRMACGGQWRVANLRNDMQATIS